MIKRLLIFVLAAAMLTGCENEPQKRSSSIFAMDTLMEITIYGGEENSVFAAEEEIIRLEKLFSVTDEKSDMYLLQNSAGETEVSQETAELVRISLEYYRQTGGVFNGALYPVSSLWGFTDENRRVPSDEEIKEGLKYTDFSDISVNGKVVVMKEGMALDMGAIAKGYAADKVKEILLEKGVLSGLLNLGGDITAFGEKPDGSLWKVAVEFPDREGYAGVLEIKDKSVATSGSYQRYFEEKGVRYHHIIDPATGRSAQSGLVSATAVCDSGTMADAYATALFIMGLEKAAQFRRERGGDFEAIFIDEEGTVYYTSGLEGVFTPGNEVNAIIID